MKHLSHLIAIAFLIAPSLVRAGGDSSVAMVKLSGYMQARFLSQQEAGKADGLDIRRARLDARGAVTKRWEYKLQAELAGSPRLLDAAISYKYHESLKLSAGQLKVPFSAENLTSSSKLVSIDRSQVVEALAARSRDVIGSQSGRDLGIQASGSLFRVGDRYVVDYVVGGFNGAGINNTGDNNEAKDLAARLLVHPLKKLDIGASYYNGYGRWGNPARDQQRIRYAAELAYSFSVIDLRGEYILGADGSIQRSGWYAQAAAFVYKRSVQLVVKYDTYDPDNSSEKKGDVTTNYVAGVNVNIIDTVRIQAAYTNRNEEGPSVNNDLVAVQLQIGF